LELAVEDPLRHGVLDLALHRAAQWTGTERRVPADLRETLLGRGADLDRHVPLVQPILELLDEQVDDLEQLVVGQVREDDDLVDAVEELGAEVLLELFLDLAAHAVVVVLRVALSLEAN